MISQGTLSDLPWNPRFHGILVEKPWINVWGFCLMLWFPYSVSSISHLKKKKKNVNWTCPQLLHTMSLLSPFSGGCSWGICIDSDNKHNSQSKDLFFLIDTAAFILLNYFCSFPEFQRIRFFSPKVSDSAKCCIFSVQFCSKMCDEI